MARELPRTLLSLAPAYQRDVRDDYELIVVDNGSKRAPRTGELAYLGGTIRVLECSSPSVSPVMAVNQGLRAAKGELIGVWIDGARMASPGLLKACLASLA